MKRNDEENTSGPEDMEGTEPSDRGCDGGAKEAEPSLQTITNINRTCCRAILSASCRPHPTPPARRITIQNTPPDKYTVAVSVFVVVVVVVGHDVQNKKQTKNKRNRAHQAYQPTRQCAYIQHTCNTIQHTTHKPTKNMNTRQIKWNLIIIHIAAVLSKTATDHHDMQRCLSLFLLLIVVSALD